MSNKPTYDELAIAVRGYEEECKALKAHVDWLREELEESNSLFVALLHEMRPVIELEEQIISNRNLLEQVPAQSLERSEKEGEASLNHIMAQVEVEE